MKISKWIVLLATCIFLVACNTQAAPTTLTFELKASIQDQLYVSDEVIPDNTVVYVLAEDRVSNLLLPSFASFNRFYTDTGGVAILHNTKIAIASGTLEWIDPLTLKVGEIDSSQP